METMSDRSDAALRERLELAKQATDGPWKESVQIVNGDAVSAVSTACGDEICNTYGNLLCDTFDAAHIAANHPEVVRADLEEILALRAEVARLNREADWLAEHLHRAGIPCPGDGEKFDPYGECAKKGWPCVACFREWARQETQEGE